MPVGLKKRQSEPLNNENKGESGPISIGTPSQNFLVDFNSTPFPLNASFAITF
jgi:hypothetical protein